MQKALTALNIHLANVISAIRGVTGLAILRALLNGERHPATLAAFKDSRIKASQPTIANSLEGNGREAWLFTLRQSLALYECSQLQIAECDACLEAPLRPFDGKVAVEAQPLPTPKRGNKNAHRNEPTCDLRTPLSRIRGVDFTRSDGSEVLTTQTLLAEIGRDMNRGKTETHFASWLGFCPDNRISGGNVLTRGTRPVVHRAADALRRAAQSLLHRKSALGANSRCLRTRLGAPKAGTAMAHTLARLVYRRLT